MPVSSQKNRRNENKYFHTLQLAHSIAEDNGTSDWILATKCQNFAMKIRKLLEEKEEKNFCSKSTMESNRDNTNSCLFHSIIFHTFDFCSLQETLIKPCNPE